jgi:hypothetical protein
MNKKFNLALISIFIIIVIWGLFVSGCSSRISPSKPVTAAQTSVEKQEKKVNETLDKINKNIDQKLDQTSTLSLGIQYSLQQVTNPTVSVNTAKTLNERIISIVGSPNIDEANRIKATVDLLNTEIEKERKKGETLLSQRDKVISNLQKDNENLKQQYDDQLWQMSDKAKQVAKSADQNQAVLDSMSGMFGLNAVFWGLKKFFFSCLTGIIIFCVIFLVLRVLASMNPIAAAAFSIFNILGTGVLSLIKGLTPKAFELANYTTKWEVDNYKSPLTKIVDVIQSLKEKQKDIPDRVYTLKDMLDLFEKDMDQKDKDMINSILKEQKWKL